MQQKYEILSGMDDIMHEGQHTSIGASRLKQNRGLYPIRSEHSLMRDKNKKWYQARKNALLQNNQEFLRGYHNGKGSFSEFIDRIINAF